MKVLGASLDLVNKKIVNLADPSAATDAVNKQYLDGVVRGLDWKQEVMAASTATVTLASPGTTLDGYTLVAQDRVLLKDQTTPAENGIYVWTASGSALTRALDADTWAELTGATVTVQRGTVNADRVYRVTADDGGTIGTTAVTTAQIGAGGTAYSAGNGLALASTTFSVQANGTSIDVSASGVKVADAAGGNGLTVAAGLIAVGAGTGITVAADTVGIDTSLVVRKFAANIGNGALTSIVTAHGLGTADLTVGIREVASGEVVYPDVTIDATNVTVVFATAPASNAYRLIVHG